MSKYPPETALEPDPNDIRALAGGLKAKPEPAHLETTYREAVEFGKYWTSVYEALRVAGAVSLETCYDDADFGEVDSELDALDAILHDLRYGILRSRRDQRAMELKYGLQASSDKSAAVTQRGLF